MTCVAFSIKFAKTNQKFAENSEFCEKHSLLLVNYSLHSLGRPRSPLAGSGFGAATPAAPGGAGAAVGMSSATVMLT